MDSLGLANAASAVSPGRARRGREAGRPEPPAPPPAGRPHRRGSRCRSNGFSALSEPSGVANRAATRSAVAESRSSRGTTAAANPRRTPRARPRTGRSLQISRAAHTDEMDERSSPPEVRDEPSWASRIQSWASSASSRRSAARASWNPAPTACPWTAATTTAGTERQIAKPRWNPRSSRRARPRWRARGCRLTWHTARCEHLPVQAGGEGRPLRPDHDDPDPPAAATPPPAPARATATASALLPRLRVREGQRDGPDRRGGRAVPRGDG
jgi:hypothetical protein